MEMVFHSRRLTNDIIGTGHNFLITPLFSEFSSSNCTVSPTATSWSIQNFKGEICL